MKVERALECAVMAAEDGNPWAEALKALAGEVKRLRTPRPMSEAPRRGEVLVLARMTSQNSVTFDALGWLPTSSGGPVPHDYVDRDGIDECKEGGA